MLPDAFMVEGFLAEAHQYVIVDITYVSFPSILKFAYFWRNMNITDSLKDSGEPALMNISLILAFVCVTSYNYVLHMVLYVIIAVFGILGNACLVCIIIGHRALRKNVNFLIFNLSLANIGFITVIVVIRMEHEMNPCWLHTVIFCKLRYFIPTMLHSVNIFTLVCLSRQRHIAVVNRVPITQIEGQKNIAFTFKMISVIWIAAVLCGLPHLWLAGKPNSYMCTPFKDWPNTTISRVYDLCLFVFLYIIPLGIIVSHYVPLVIMLQRSAKMPEGRRHNEPATNKSRKQLIIIVLIITIAFAILWLPHHLYAIVFHYVDLTGLETSDMLRHAVYYLQVMNSCLDPYIVFAMSSSHRRYLMRYSKCRCVREYISSRKTPTLTVNHTRTRSSTIQSMQMTQMTAQVTSSRANHASKNTLHPV